MRTHRPRSDGLARGASHRPRVRVARVQVGARAECRTHGGGKPRLDREAREGVAARIARGATKLKLDLHQPVVFRVPLAARDRARLDQDRKSTRLNSSHDQISYAVFCLKKKNSTHPPSA